MLIVGIFQRFRFNSFKNFACGKRENLVGAAFAGKFSTYMLQGLVALTLWWMSFCFSKIVTPLRRIPIIMCIDSIAISL